MHRVEIGDTLVQQTEIEPVIFLFSDKTSYAMPLSFERIYKASIIY